MSGLFGYARVSTIEQNETRQMFAFERLGIPVERIFMDKQSGRDFKRPQYSALVRKLKAGDVLCVQSIDRLGRNYQEIQNQWRKLTHDKGVDLVVLDTLKKTME